MRTLSLVLIALAPLVWLVASPAAVAEDAPPTPEQQIQGLAYLEGIWSGPIGPGTWEARYTSPTGGEVLSTNKEIRNARVVSFEFERFRVQDGKVLMTPWVKGKQSVDFTLTALDEDAMKATFENPAHDFPQRIIYHRSAKGVLEIHVTAQRGEKHAGFSLKLEKQP